MASDDQRARNGPREHPRRPDAPRAEGVEDRRDLGVMGSGGEQQPLSRAEAPTGGVVVDQERVSAQLAAMTAPIARQALVQRLGAEQGGRDRVREPLRALHRPPAADAPQRIGRERRVADQREPRRDRPTDPVGHVELAEHGAHEPRLADRRRVDHPGDEVDQRLRRVAPELGQQVFRGHRRVEGQAGVGRERGRPVRVRHPHRGVGRAVGPRSLEVAAVREAVVRAHAGAHSRQLGDARVASVGADDELAAQRRLRAVAVARHDPAYDAVLMHERVRGAAEHELHAGRRGGGLAHERIEQLAPQVHRAPGVLGARGDPPPLAPGADARAHAAGGLDLLQDAETLQRR